MTQAEILAEEAGVQHQALADLQRCACALSRSGTAMAAAAVSLARVAALGTSCSSAAVAAAVSNGFARKIT